MLLKGTASSVAFLGHKITEEKECIKEMANGLSTLNIGEIILNCKIIAWLDKSIEKIGEINANLEHFALQPQLLKY